MSTPQAAGEWDDGRRLAVAASLAAARREGALSAHLVVSRQAEAGMSPDAIEASAERVLADRHVTTDPAELAFYDEYDTTAATYTRELREMEAGG